MQSESLIKVCEHVNGDLVIQNLYDFDLMARSKTKDKLVILANRQITIGEKRARQHLWTIGFKGSDLDMRVTIEPFKG